MCEQAHHVVATFVLGPFFASGRRIARQQHVVERSWLAGIGQQRLAACMARA